MVSGSAAGEAGGAVSFGSRPSIEHVSYWTSDPKPDVICGALSLSAVILAPVPVARVGAAFGFRV